MNNKSDFDALLCVLKRSAGALEALAQRFASKTPDQLKLEQDCDCYLWQAENSALEPIHNTKTLSLELLKGIQDNCERLLTNTRYFAANLPANNALLWGARGMGKSSLVKAVHAQVRQEPNCACRLLLIEIQRDDIASLPALIALLNKPPFLGSAAKSAVRVILFCDDLSFEHEDATYKALKTALDGGLMGKPDHVVFYATSNRRHLMARTMIENESQEAINPHEAGEEKISLSDRFGLWLGFHKCSQDSYLEMIDGYAALFDLYEQGAKLGLQRQDFHAQALEWAITRGARSGRVAWQYIQQARAACGYAQRDKT